MGLTTGKYTICNLGNETFIERSTEGDTTSVVFVKSDAERVPWYIEKGDDDIYILKADGAPAISKDNKVVVSLDEDVADNEIKWRVTSPETYAENVYLIIKPDWLQGWNSFDGQPGDPVKSTPLIVQPSYPPRYPTFELWTINPVPDE